MAAMTLVLACAADAAQPSTGSGAPGVNPKDNITKGEMFYKFDRLDGGASLQAVAFKYDRAFGAEWGANVEVPLVRVDTGARTVSGLGDLVMRVRHVKTHGPWSVLLATELVLPTARDDALGAGKVQINPAGGLVYALAPTSFVYAGYRHAFSVGGDGDRADISDMQPRVVWAQVWEQGYWVLADAKYTKQLKGAKQETLDLEVEGGSMVSPTVGAWVRVGTSSMESPRRWGVLLGLRRIWR